MKTFAWRPLFLIFTAIATASWGIEARATTDCDKAACDQVRAQIREIEAKMRSGYTRAQGERYERRLRTLRDRRRSICR